EKRSLRTEIGMVFQGSALFDSMNVEENIAFPLKMFTSKNNADIRNRVQEVIERVNLKDANKKMPSELSGGMKKRVSIARAIVNNPKYLFCDEPNSGLDPQTAIRIDDLIGDLTEEYSMTTIVVTHDMNSVLGIGQNILFIYQGRKLWEGSNKDIMHSGVKDFDDFVFANKVMNQIREK